jgi:hypothetical protein
MRFVGLRSGFLRGHVHSGLGFSNQFSYLVFGSKRNIGLARETYECDDGVRSTRPRMPRPSRSQPARSRARSPMCLQPDQPL